MRTASNSPLTQKYGDKTTHVSITVLCVLKLIGSPVLTQLHTGPKNAGSQFLSVGPKHAAGCRVDFREFRLNRLNSISGLSVILFTQS